MALKKRTWIYLIVGAIALVIFIGIALVATTAFLVTRQLQVEQMSEQSAEEEFAATRRKFAGQKPLIEMRAEAGASPQSAFPHVNRDVIATGKAQPLNSLMVMAWDPEEDELVRMNIPFWLVRLGQTFKLGSETGLSRELEVTAGDLEKRGPGLILDHRESDGTRVLVWTE